MLFHFFNLTKAYNWGGRGEVEPCFPPRWGGCDSRDEHQLWAVMLPEWRGVETLLDLWPHSVLRSTAKRMFPQVIASDLKKKSCSYMVFLQTTIPSCFLFNIVAPYVMF